MTCVNCQNKIERKLKNTAGVSDASVRWSAGSATVTFDERTLTERELGAVITRLGYSVSERAGGSDHARAAALAMLILALYILARQFGLTALWGGGARLAETGMGYGMLFVTGLFTSVHCVAMCGGINLSQCIPSGALGGGGALRPGLLYNLGRVVSYTAVGALVGALGSVVSFSGWARGLVQLIAGVFMVVMGLNMLSLFPSLRRLTPRLPRFLADRVEAAKLSGKSPLIVGLLNGLMPCGPLQAMQLYALSAGSPARGAVSMLLFSLGTVPLMFGLGALSSVLSRKFTGRIMTAGAVLVVVLGLMMFSSGWSLSGFKIAGGSSAGAARAELQGGVQVVETTLASGRYKPISVRAGIPVQWTISAPDGSVNGCNNRLIIQEYGVEAPLAVGENLIEFTPARAGTYTYTCWMGMIRSTITVTE
jgi:sulfite exporter TauE/SafE